MATRWGIVVATALVAAAASCKGTAPDRRRIVGGQRAAADALAAAYRAVHAVEAAGPRLAALAEATAAACGPPCACLQRFAEAGDDAAARAAAVTACPSLCTAEARTRAAAASGPPVAALAAACGPGAIGLDVDGAAGIGTDWLAAWVAGQYLADQVDAARDPARAAMVDAAAALWLPLRPAVGGAPGTLPSAAHAGPPVELSTYVAIDGAGAITIGRFPAARLGPGGATLERSPAEPVAQIEDLAAALRALPGPKMASAAPPEAARAGAVAAADDADADELPMGVSLDGPGALVDGARGNSGAGYGRVSRDLATGQIGLFGGGTPTPAPPPRFFVAGQVRSAAPEQPLVLAAADGGALRLIEVAAATGTGGAIAVDVAGEVAILPIVLGGFDPGWGPGASWDLGVTMTVDVDVAAVVVATPLGEPYGRAALDGDRPDAAALAAALDRATAASTGGTAATVVVHDAARVGALVAMLDALAAAGVTTMRLVSWEPPIGQAPQLRIGPARLDGPYDPTILRRYLRRYQSRMLRCYRDHLVDHADAAGDVALAFAIGADGKPADVVARGVAPELEACVRDAIAAATLPRPRQAAPTQVQVALTFRAGQPP
ncbi:MAG: hypothetical protein H6708_32665 [Kofleriaceae bacterium]|nr:hypothetical protein [Kofleriaceae bacterium]